MTLLNITGYIVLLFACLAVASMEQEVSFRMRLDFSVEKPKALTAGFVLLAVHLAGFADIPLTGFVAPNFFAALVTIK
ncbi:hypothetical protein [Rosistilla oblonga]|uniref:hypothetical protein n=1 Tax=Rosistilla oblonga TaxID=2527990 RepID=UPI0011AAE48B|nr:hypothetical protein [Rosistilla oblonga]